MGCTTSIRPPSGNPFDAPRPISFQYEVTWNDDGKFQVYRIETSSGGTVKYRLLPLDLSLLYAKHKQEFRKPNNAAAIEEAAAIVKARTSKTKK